MVAGVVVTGLGIELGSDFALQDLLLHPQPPPPGRFDPAQKVGGKGLRYKDRATLLALCAVRSAVQHAGLESADFSRTGVVVSSNLGNVDSVCRAAATIHAHSVEHLSPMGLPNVSSNNIASTLAIRWGFRGPNLTLCNGSTSGVDALYLASVMLRTGRATRMMVVGVEPYHEVGCALMALSEEGPSPVRSPIPLGEGAACMVLETAASAAQRAGVCYGHVGRYHFTAPSRIQVSELVGMFPAGAVPSLQWFTPDRRWVTVSTLTAGVQAALGDAPLPIMDLGATLGDLYGAMGVFQSVAACAWLTQSTSDMDRTALVTAGGSRNDGIATLQIDAVVPPLLAGG